MSGDVQPRKRKEKRKKKDGGSLGTIHDQATFQKFTKDFDEKKKFDLPDQGEKIHVQNEHGIGGNICVKIIFFCLLGLLVGAIGLIYQQYQGSTDVELPSIEESRFAEYFTGWLDEGSDDHEHESVENLAHEDSGEHDEHDEHDENNEDMEEEHAEEEEEDEHNEDEDERDETDDRSGEQDDEPGLISRILGMQRESEKDAEESVDEEFIKSVANEINEEIHDSEIDEEDEDEYNDRNYKYKHRRRANDDDDDDDDDETNNLQEEIEEEENESEENEKKDKGTQENDDSAENKEDEEEDRDSGIDDNDDDDEEEEEEGQEDDEENDVSQPDDRYKRKSGIRNYSDEKDDDDDEDEIKENEEDEEDEDEKDSEKESKEKEQIDNKDEEDDNVSAEQDFNERVEEDKEKSKWTNEDDTDDLGYDEIDESGEEEEAEEDEKKGSRESTQEEEEEEEEEEEQEDIDEKLKLKKDLPPETDEDIDEAVESRNVAAESEDTSDDDTQEGGVAVKLGVGIALIIVAHLVLVQKWKAKGNASLDESTPNEEIEKKKVVNLTSQPEEVISRRQTLVPEDAFPRDKFNYEEFDDEELEEEEEGGSEEYSEEDEECKEDVVVKQSEKGQTFEKPALNSHMLDADEEVEEEEECESDEDVADEEEYDEEDVENEEEYEEDDEMEEKESEEETDDDDYERETESESSNTKKQRQPVSEVEEIPPTPPPRSHKRGPQDISEEADEFTSSEDTRETLLEADEGVLKNSPPPPEESKTSEKQTESDSDWYFGEELSYADEHFENNPKESLKTYDQILSKKRTIVRALIGRARVLDHLAEKERSNAYLKQATNAYKSLLLEHGNLIQDDTYLKLAERCIERMRFGGYLGSAIDVHKAIIHRFPNTPKYRNTLSVTYLMLNKIELARNVLKETLALWPGNGFALVHYGFILKTTDNNMEEAVRKLTAGIQTKEEGVIDGMFFFHLGDALNRLGRPQEAMKWYDLGVREGLFLSKYQRSLYNVNRLRGQPWWTKEETTYQSFFKKLEDNWREIQKEGLALLNSKGISLFKEETENLKDTGDWRQLDLYFRGRQQSNCKLAPVTCSLVSSFKPAAGCTRGQIKFSVMLPDTHVWPHCGPTNCRLRSHLGLIVPKFTYIRVAEETRSWEEGKFIIFDDSFEHEVWHNGTGPRLVLIVDVWHPELTQQERQSLSPI